MSETLVIAYYSLFDTGSVSPKEVVRRLEEVCPDFKDDGVVNKLVMEGKLVRVEYNYKIGDVIYAIVPEVMTPMIKWLFDTQEGHAVLDRLKPLYNDYDMEQTPVQRIVSGYVRTKYKNDIDGRSIFRNDLPYLIPVCDDEKFAPLFRGMSESTFAALIESSVNDAYLHSRLLRTEVMRQTINDRRTDDSMLRHKLSAIIDVYDYLAYGRIDINVRRHAKIPETHLISALYETFHGHYESALLHFAESQRLYNIKVSQIDLRNLFPQPIINTIQMLANAHMATSDSLRQLDLMVKRKPNALTIIPRVLSKVLHNVERDTVGEEMRNIFLKGNQMDKEWITLLTRYSKRNDIITEQALANTQPTWAFMRHEFGEITPELNSAFGEKQLLMSIYRQAPWETTIEALMSKLGGRSSDAPIVERRERLAYYIEHINDDLATVRLQTTMKNGTWSIGKAVSLTQIKALEPKSLMPGDVLIKEKNLSTYFHNDHHFTLSSILPEMTEQSRLYVGKYAPYSLVTVTEEVPYFIVERVEGGFEIKSNIQLKDVDKEIVVLSRGATSINYAVLSDELRPFFSHLLSVGFFPSEAEDRLKEFLKSLGTKVEIHSPLIKGGTTLETIEGTSRLTLQMRPKGREGYVCTLFCRPMEGGRVQCKPGVGLDTIIDQKDGRRYCVNRDKDKESAIREALYMAVDDMPRELEFETDAYGLLPIVDYLREHKEEVDMEWPEGHKLRIRQRYTQSQWHATLKKNNNGWFELEGRLQVDENTFMSMQQLLDLIGNNRSRYIKLGDDQYMVLSESLRRQLSEIDVLATRSRGHLQMSAFTAALLDNSIMNGELQIEVDEELADVRRKILSLSDYKAPVPKTLNATLRGYQKEGYEWIARLNEWGAGALLADDMGLGKTVQTIAYLLHKAEEGPQLVIAPASVAPNWRSELERFAPSLNVQILNFASNRSTCIAKAGAGDIIISTYALLLSVREEITHKEWVTACLDEAHVIKNRGAKTSGVCMKLKAKNRIMLTGTPVQNHLGELWNLFQFVNPGLLGSYEDYGRRFITPIEVAHDGKRKEELERLVKPFMLRRTKDAVLSELPEKTDIYQTVNLSAEEMAVYEVIRQNAETMLLAEEKEDKVSLNTLAEITRLRQAACSAELVDKQWHGRSSKVEAIVEALEPIVESGDAALVFSQFTSFLAIVKEALDNAHIPYLYIDGSVPVKERQRLVERFQTPPQPSPRRESNDTLTASETSELTSTSSLGGGREGVGRVLIAGSIGPTNRTCSISGDVNNPAARDVTFQELVDTYTDCVRGLIDGGVDVILIETIFDTLNAKAALKAVDDVAKARGIDIPVMASCTLSDASGRTLSGQTVEAFYASMKHGNLLSIGLNCGFGAKQLLPWLRRLADVAECPVSVHPNAGLPNVMGGYDETPETFAAVAKQVFEEGLVNIYGGCCGTSPEHIKALKATNPTTPPQPSPGRESNVTLCGQTPQPENVTLSSLPGEGRGGVGVCLLSGLEPLSLDGTFINVGERTNVAGSLKFKKLIQAKNYDEALTIARHQVEKGAQVIDICMDDGLIDGVEAMTTFLNLIASEPEIARVPVMIDSSKWEILKAGLQCVQGKSIVNSISLKEGEDKFLEKAQYIRSIGAATVVMLFDEKGQADTYERKMEVARRAYRLLRSIGFPGEDIIFDPNVLAVATGMPEHDDYARAFIEACRTIHEEMPEVHMSGGISNLSFSFRGNNTIRQAMHSVFLHHAMEAGLDMSIVNPAMTTNYNDLPADMLEVVEDVILNRNSTAAERLIEFAEKVKEEEEARKGTASPSALPRREGTQISLKERISYAMLKGIADNIEADTLEAYNETGSPLGVIDTYLMPAMEQVGKLFGEGKMFLPQVVKSARVMKKAVGVLTPLMKSPTAPSQPPRGEELEDTLCGQTSQPENVTSISSPRGGQEGAIVMATVKGDVHDIGKNIVSVVTQCNGYDVKDLGVMVDAEVIVSTAKEWNADIIGLSGLITPSLDEMIRVIRMLRDNGMTTPVIVGGATTSALHTAVKMAPEYPDGIVIHSMSAAENATIIRRLLAEDGAEYIAELKSQQRIIRENYYNKEAQKASQLTLEEARKRRHVKSADEIAVPSAEALIPLHSDNHSLLHPKGECLCCNPLVPRINWQFFFSAWGIKGHFPEVLEDKDKGAEARKLWHDAQQLLDKIIRLRLLRLQMKAQILPAYSEDDTIVITTPDGKTHALPFQRSLKDEPETKCLADYIAKKQTTNTQHPTPNTDYICPFIVSAGVGLAELQERFRKDGDEYHAIMAKLLADRLAEAMAEKLSDDLTNTLHWGTKNIRMAFGYGACPDHSLKQQVFDILGVDDKMGLSLTDTYMINPGESICGLIFANTPTKYFQIEN